MTKPYQKWREDCVVFLDDCFASDKAVATLSPYFDVRDFRLIFRDPDKGKQNGVEDHPIIHKCHQERWLLLTMDPNMGETHVEEIAKNPCVTILAAAHNAATPEEFQQWLNAVVKLQHKIRRMFKHEQRPWFAKFTREGNISSFKTITPDMKTRRTRKK